MEVIQGLGAAGPEYSKFQNFHGGQGLGLRSLGF